jgi:hypothetical protein
MQALLRCLRRVQCVTLQQSVLCWCYRSHTATTLQHYNWFQQYAICNVLVACMPFRVDVPGATRAIARLVCCAAAHVQHLQCPATVAAPTTSLQISHCFCHQQTHQGLRRPVLTTVWSSILGSRLHYSVALMWAGTVNSMLPGAGLCRRTMHLTRTQ